MKRALVIFTVILIFVIIGLNIFTMNVYAENVNSDNEEGIIGEVTASQGNLIKLKENQAKTLEEYQIKYGSDTYGTTAYILHMVQVYSIPFCFLGIVVCIILHIVMGARHLENAEKGLAMLVAVVTFTIICQVLPLVFALVVKLGRE